VSQCPLWVTGGLVEHPRDVGLIPKSKQNAEAVEQDSPHFVGIAVPAGGLRAMGDAMKDCQARQGLQPKRGQGRHDANGRCIRWCFADPTVTFACEASSRNKSFGE
jgi:hypothetical protein